MHPVRKPMEREAPSEPLPCRYRLPIMPFEMVHFALKGPIFCERNQLVPHRIGLNISPFLAVAF